MLSLVPTKVLIKMFVFQWPQNEDDRHESNGENPRGIDCFSQIQDCDSEGAQRYSEALFQTFGS